MTEREKKEKRHTIADNFRRQIESASQRAEAIKTLMAKQIFDESDQIRIRELLRRTDYAISCEKEYTQLISRLYQDDTLRSKAEEFYKRWNA